MANLRNAVVLVFAYVCQKAFLSTCQVFFLLPDSFLWSVHLRLNYKLDSAVN